MTQFAQRTSYSFDVDKFLALALKGEILDEVTIKVICAKVKEIFSAEENVKPVQSPVTVVGDVHG